MKDVRRPTSWFLDQLTGWRADEALVDALALGSRLGLMAAPDGPGSLTAPDGSVGGLRLPPPVGIDADGRVHLARTTSGRVLRLGRDGRFRALPGVGGATGDARALLGPTRLVLDGDRLIVLDEPTRRVVVFDRRSLTLLATWERPPTGTWQPTDVAALEGRTYVLDSDAGVVFATDDDRPPAPLSIEGLEPGLATAVLVDRIGRLYLLEADAPRLLIRAADGSGADVAGSAAEVVDRFEAPGIRFDHLGRLRIPGVGAFDREGRPVVIHRYEPAGPRPLQRSGTFVTTPLDGGTHGCRWDRVELTIPDLPEGASIVVRTATADDREVLKNDPVWSVSPAIRGHADADSALSPSSRRPLQVLVQSQPGQFLTLRLDLAGDGWTSPEIESIRIRYPRGSWLDHLPGVFSADRETGGFLERFLAIFQAEADGLDDLARRSARQFDMATADGPFLDYLASWMDLRFEGRWDIERRRRALETVTATYRIRGTLEGLRRVIAGQLVNLSPGARDPSPFPVIVEAFRERGSLTVDGSAVTYAPTRPLWGRARVGRLQLDAGIREGDARLVSTGDPHTDVVTEFAHRFRVYVPASLVRTSADEAELRRAIDDERPAHTQYRLELVEPRLRLGIQSMVGVDSVIGDYPTARLPGQDDPSAPSRGAVGRLGSDTVLAPAPALGPGMRVDRSTRLGISSSLA